jgi:voltage-gated sodium channel
MATGLFGAQFPDWFGGIDRSMYTLFQVMTLESWSMGIVRPLMEHYPYAWLFFIPFILIATFTILNLFIAIIVDTMQSMHTRALEQEREHIEQAAHQDSAHLEKEIRTLREEIRALRGVIGQQR